MRASLIVKPSSLVHLDLSRSDWLKELPYRARLARESCSWCSIRPCSTSCRRMSTILGMCSMWSGQTSMQARQVVQAHRVSSLMASPNIWEPPAAVGRGPMPSCSRRWLRKSMISSLGLRG